jgi:hypothetical protein
MIKKEKHRGRAAAIIWSAWNGLSRNDPSQRGGLSHIDR